MDTLCVQETLAKSPNADVSDSISSSIRSRSQILLHQNHGLRPRLILPLPESSEKIAGCLPAQSIRSRSHILLHRDHSLRRRLILTLPGSSEQIAGCMGKSDFKARAFGRDAVSKVQHTKVALGREGLVSCTWGPG